MSQILAEQPENFLLRGIGAMQMGRAQVASRTENQPKGLLSGPAAAGARLRMTCGFLRSVVSTFRSPASGAPGMPFAVWTPEVSASVFHSIILLSRPLKPLMKDPLSKTDTTHPARGPRAAPGYGAHSAPRRLGDPDSQGLHGHLVSPFKRSTTGGPPPHKHLLRSSGATRNLAEGRTQRSESARMRPERPRHA